MVDDGSYGFQEHFADLSRLAIEVLAVNKDRQSLVNHFVQAVGRLPNPIFANNLFQTLNLFFLLLTVPRWQSLLLKQLHCVLSQFIQLMLNLSFYRQCSDNLISSIDHLRVEVFLFNQLQFHKLGPLVFLRQLKGTNEHGDFDIQVLLKVNAKALNEEPRRGHDLFKNFAHRFVHVSLDKAEG